MADLFPFSRRQLRSIKAERSEEISEYGILRKVYSHVRLPALRTAVNAISASGRENQLPERPGKRGTQKQAMKMIAAAADRLKVPLSTAMELLKEYEQGLGSGKVKNAS